MIKANRRTGCRSVPISRQHRGVLLEISNILRLSLNKTVIRPPYRRLPDGAGLTPLDNSNSSIPRGKRNFFIKEWVLRTGF